MTNVISYNDFPDKHYFIDLYVVKKLRLIDIASIFGCNTVRIRKWAKYFNLDFRGHCKRAGAGNHRKYFVDKVILQKLVDKGYSNKLIGYEVNLPAQKIKYLLHKHKIKRTKEHRTKYRKYCLAVRRLSNQNYDNNKYLINPNNHRRTLCGVEGGYQLDHIIGVQECFAMGHTVEFCASVDNLQFISWQDNLEKRKYIKRLSNE